MGVVETRVHFIKSHRVDGDFIPTTKVSVDKDCIQTTARAVRRSVVTKTDKILIEVSSKQFTPLNFIKRLLPPKR